MNSVLSALDGVCTRSRVSEEGRTRVGCESCPGGWGKKAPRPAIGSSAPELEVLRVFEADLLGTGSRIAVLSYTGCQPGIFGYAGTLVVDADSKKLLRDEAGLDLTRCRAYPSAGRETLVCVAELEHQKGMAGKTDYALGVYDPVDLRAVDSDDPADIAAWHSIPLASSDAAYDCISGGPPPGAPIRFVRVLGLAVDPESARVTVRGLSAAGPSTKAFEEACAAEADPGDALGAMGFAIDFQLAGKELVPTAGAQRWLSKHR